MDCFASIAFYKSSTKICETNFVGTLAKYKPVCLALATRNEQECTKASDEFVESDCYRSLAFALVDEKFCELLNAPALRPGCFSMVLQVRSLRG
jgi:hypothetical protein